MHVHVSMRAKVRMSNTVKPVYSDRLWPQRSDLNMEVVSLLRSKSIVQVLLGHNQVVFRERWSLDTDGL